MNSSDSKTPAPSRSGITIDVEGQSRVASSTRADGSQRKEIKIRPGYRPPEDVDVYKNRTAEAWKTRGSGGVPGAASVEDESTSNNASSNKNAKRREARKKAKAAEEAQAGDSKTDVDVATGQASADKPNVNKQEAGSTSQEANPDADKDKKIKRLKKKLREAQELKAKKESGQGLLQEQFEKVIKINELMRDLEKLGVNDEEKTPVVG